MSATSSPISPPSSANIPDGYPKMIVRGEGAYVFDEDGNRLLDAGSHLGACQIGHGRAEVAERIADQVAKLEFIALDAGISHIYVAELAERLAAIVALRRAGLLLHQQRQRIERARLQDRPHLSRPPRRAGAHQDHLAPRLLSRLVYRRLGGDRRRRLQDRLRAAARRTSSRPSRRPATRFGHRERVVGGELSLRRARGADRARGPGDGRRDHRRAGRDPRAVKIPHSDYFTGLRKTLRRARHPAHHRRGGLRLRAHRQDVRRRAFRRDGRHRHLRQGPDQRLYPDGRGGGLGPGQRGVPQDRRSSTSTPMPAIRSPARRRWPRSTSSRTSGWSRTPPRWKACSATS